MLDTEKSRQKPNWEGMGHQTKDMAEIILYLWDQYRNNISFNIHEITINNIKL